MGTLLGTPVQLHVNANILVRHHVAGKACWHNQLLFRPNMEWLLVLVSLLWVISQTVDLLGFFYTVSRCYRKWHEKQKTSSEQWFCGKTHLANERGQRRMARQAHAARMDTVIQILGRSDESGFLLQHTEGRVRMRWNSMNPGTHLNLFQWFTLVEVVVLWCGECFLF